MRILYRLAATIAGALAGVIRRRPAFPEQTLLDQRWRKIRASQLRQDRQARRRRLGPYKRPPQVYYEQEWRKRA
jgi:hypothetical protein